MRTISITTEDLDFINKVYNSIPVNECKNTVSIDISNWADDEDDEECCAEEWMTFGDMMNLLLLELPEYGTTKTLSFVCKSFNQGDFIKIKKCVDGTPYLTKFCKSINYYDVYNPSFEEMFNYMWKEV